MKFLNNLGVEKTVQLDFKAQTQVVPSDNLSRKLYWDDFNRTLSLEMGNGVIQQIGKERLVDVRNATASPIPNGTLVMITGALGASGRLTIAPAISDGSVSSFDILGVTTEDITSGSDGIVTTFGLISGIDTTGSAVGETWTAGDTLYPHPTILGALTNVLPQAPHLKAIVGRVNFVDATTGNIFIRLQIVSGSGGSGSGGGLVYQTPSVGDIKITAALDDNHLWCDGQAVSRITYADLFEVIGTTYGPGDGVTTFNLPDFNPFLDADSIATVKSYFGTTPPDGWLWTQGQALSRVSYAGLFAVIGETYGVGDGVTTFNLPTIGTNYIIKVSNLLNNKNDGGLFYKSAICFRNFREVLNSSAFNPFLDADSIATVKSYFGTTPPDGWLWTQGQALSRVSYAGLFAVIGETYGVGDGVTTFNLPTIGTNYIIKVSNLLNNKVAELPTALTLTTYSETTVALTQGSAGTSVLADFDASKYMSAELVLQITQGAKFEMTKLHVISNGTDTYLEEYGRLGIAASVTFSTAISGSLVQIKVTSTTNPATIKGKITRILK